MNYLIWLKSFLECDENAMQLKSPLSKIKGYADQIKEMGAKMEIMKVHSSYFGVAGDVTLDQIRSLGRKGRPLHDWHETSIG